MKTLILIRHAKSSWRDPTLQDFDRPLNKRGRRNAPFMGQILRQKNISFDQMYTSPAKRAADTARYICAAMDYAAEGIEAEPGLYHASADDLLDFVHALDNQLDAVAIVGHNPGLNDFTNMLGDKPIDNVPTAGVVILRASVDHWPEIRQGAATLHDFDYPKRYLKK